MNKREIQAYGEWQQELPDVNTAPESWQAVPAALMLLTENGEDIERLKNDQRLKELLKILQLPAEEVFLGAWRQDTALPLIEDLSERERGELTIALHHEISRVRPKVIISFGDFLLKILTKRLDFQIDLSEDQLYMIDLAGRSYCLYPMPEISRQDWEQALDKLERTDFLRLRKLFNEFVAEKMEEEPADSRIEREKREKRSALPEQEKAGEKGAGKQPVASGKVATDLSHGERAAQQNVPVDRKARKAGKKLVMIGADSEETPATYALHRAAEVFTELGLTVETYKLAESSDEEVLQALIQAAGAVIGVTVEWYGIGSRLQRLLESCYAAQPQAILAEMPLFAIVFSRNGYEREAAAYLTQAWRLLGGWQGTEITGVFADRSDLTENAAALEVVEKKAEQFFRYGLNQSYQLPQSAQSEQSRQAAGEAAPTPETERVQKEKANVKALSHKLQAKLEQKTRQTKQSLAELILQNYVGGSDREYRLQLMVKDKPAENTFVLIKKTGVYAYAGEEDAILTLFAEEEMLRRCLLGELSFQKAFMTGQLSAKGELTLLYKLEGFFRGEEAD